jgi:hypothetical protein
VKDHIVPVSEFEKVRSIHFYDVPKKNITMELNAMVTKLHLGIATPSLSSLFLGVFLKVWKQICLQTSIHKIQRRLVASVKAAQGRLKLLKVG